MRSSASQWSPCPISPERLLLITSAGAGDRLITAGMIDDEPACGGAPKDPDGIQCPRGYVVGVIDPKTMAVTEVARGPAAAPYRGTAMTVQVGNELWLSSFNSDRLAYRSLRK